MLLKLVTLDDDLQLFLLVSMQTLVTFTLYLVH